MKNISKFLILMIFGSVLFTGCQGSTNSENAEANAAMKDSQNEDGSMAHFDKVIGELRDGQIVMVADADELRARLPHIRVRFRELLLRWVRHIVSIFPIQPIRPN